MRIWYPSCDLSSHATIETAGCCRDPYDQANTPKRNYNRNRRVVFDLFFLFLLRFALLRRFCVLRFFVFSERIITGDVGGLRT